MRHDFRLPRYYSHIICNFDNRLEWQQQICLYCNRVSSCRHSALAHTGGGDDFAQRVRPMLTILRTNNVRGSGGKGSNQTSTIIILLIIDLTRRVDLLLASPPFRDAKGCFSVVVVDTIGERGFPTLVGIIDTAGLGFCYR